jgi:hypothetical protein
VTAFEPSAAIARSEVAVPAENVLLKAVVERVLLDANNTLK